MNSFFIFHFLRLSSSVLIIQNKKWGVPTFQSLLRLVEQNHYTIFGKAGKFFSPRWGMFLAISIVPEIMEMGMNELNEAYCGGLIKSWVDLPRAIYHIVKIVYQKLLYQPEFHLLP